MRSRKFLVLPALALLLAGGALLAQNLSAGSADSPAVTGSSPTATRPADEAPKTVADWKETGNTRPPPGGTSSGGTPIHTVQP